MSHSTMIVHYELLQFEMAGYIAPAPFKTNWGPLLAQSAFSNEINVILRVRLPSSHAQRNHLKLHQKCRKVLAIIRSMCMMQKVMIYLMEHSANP